MHSKPASQQKYTQQQQLKAMTPTTAPKPSPGTSAATLPLLTWEDEQGAFRKCLLQQNVNVGETTMARDSRDVQELTVKKGEVFEVRILVENLSVLYYY
jgi:hypothetical protein